MLPVSAAGFPPQTGTEDLHVEQVQALLHALVAPDVLTASSTEPLQSCLGRVLARDVISTLDVPPHDNAAMDGYAFDGIALRDAAAAGGPSVQLQVVGTALAGQPWAGTLEAGQALRIMTGAVMPRGADTVVPQEQCERMGERVHVAPSNLRPGAHRRRAGEDLAAGQCALPAGTRLGPAALGLLASLGLTTAPVLRPLRVAVFSTGDELLEPGQPPREGAIYDSNRFTLLALLTRLGCDAHDLGRIADWPAVLEAALREAALAHDVVITSGGVSLGDADHLRTVLQSLGRIAFWRVAMRPGRPLAVGQLPVAAQNRRTLLFGLPGNPVAAMLSFLLFVRPALLQLMGCGDSAQAAAPMVRARALQPIRKRPGRTEYQRGWLQSQAGALPTVSIAADQGSALLSTLHAANALVVLPHASGSLEAGAEVDVLLLDTLI